MPRTYQRRSQPCSHCGDVVLVVEERLGKIFGKQVGVKPKVMLEHADPSPDGDVFDEVDDGCRRVPVRELPT